MTGTTLLAMIRKQPLAFGCGLIVLACGLALFFRNEAVDEAQELFRNKDDEAVKTEANARNAAGLAEATAEMQEAAKQFESRLVRAPQLANNLQFFYRIEADTGVKLVDVRQMPLQPPRQGAPRGAYVSVPFTANIQGSYAQVHDFLRRLQAGPHFLRVTQLTLTKLTSGGEGVAAGPDAMSAIVQLEILGTP
ncbi:MAG: hypothetical protein C0502_04200 [Opitutus sp.]|nr:hypothetical protein [Opitutus sp.]